MKRILIVLAALGSPLVWFASHSAQFALAPLTCPWRSNLVLWVVLLVALILDLGSGLFAWRLEPPTMPRWLALGGAALSAAFFIVIIAQAIPLLILGGCA